MICAQAAGARRIPAAAKRLTKGQETAAVRGRTMNIKETCR
jgi:hypothetical protein